MPRFERILLTGAAGQLGTELRRGLTPLARRIRLGDRQACKNIQPHEEEAIFDLADMDATIAACADCDAIVHFGGAPSERPWQEILDSSIRGSYHIYEGARKHRVPRIVYASSVHAIGYYRVEDNIGLDVPHRPDGLYGVSKCFVEDLSRLYWDKFGIESACLRIFSSLAEPNNRRALWSYLSYDDCIRLVEAALVAPRVAHSVIFGMSDNRVKPTNNKLASHLGYDPQDSAEPYRARIEAEIPLPGPKSGMAVNLGGWFVDMPHPDDAPKSG